MPPSRSRYIDGSRIVKDFSGPMTGDKCYQTADGNMWRSSNAMDIKSRDGTGIIIRGIETRSVGTQS